MGCLKNITRAIFLTIIIMGFVAFGGKDWIRNQYNDFVHPTHDMMMEKAQKIGDFSKIDKEFEIEKAAGIFGYNAVVAEHKASGQKMIVVDSGKKTILTTEDIKADDSETRIKNAINKFKYQAAAIEEFNVIEKGTMNSYGQTVPYVKFKAKIKKIPSGDISGIISVVKDNDGSDKILVSVSQSGKYSQLISNEFFKEIKSK
ncbi:hypothetical protein IJ579_03795 [bacterium]|nr:hypothetical protein [bacterium]